MSKFEKQLISNLKEYERAGIFDSVVRYRFEKYLSAKIDESRTSVRLPLQYVLFTLGISIISLGFILVIAYNWTEFSNPTRLFFGFVPLLLSGGLGLWYFATKSERGAYWREIIPLLNTTGIITSIAVVSQVYHIESDGLSFMRAVIILSALLPFLFNSGISTLINIACIMTAYIDVNVPREHFISLLYIGLIGIFLTRSVLGGENNPVKAFSLAVFIIVVPIYCVFFMNKYGIEYYNLDSIVYPLFCGLMLAVLSLASPETRKYMLPAGVVAGLTSFILIFIFAFESGLSLFRNDYFYDHAYREFILPQWGILAIIAACALFYFYFFIKSLISKQSDKGMLGLSFVGFMGLAMFFSSNGIFHLGDGVFTLYYLCFNVYAVLMTLVFIASGIRNSSLGSLNVGALMLAAFIFTKFLSDDFTMLSRGIAFIVLGIVIIMLNGFTIRLRKERAA